MAISLRIRQYIIALYFDFFFKKLYVSFTYFLRPILSATMIFRVIVHLIWIFLKKIKNISHEQSTIYVLSSHNNKNINYIF